VYCRQWCELIEAVAEHFTEHLEDEQGFKYNNYVVEFPNGSRINCMSSNPRRFRSKGGDVCLDEFDWHDRPGEMLDAATPVTTWGYDLSILTTRNGEGTEFDNLVKKARKIINGDFTAKQLKTLPWSYHFTPITVAVEQGLAEKIRKLEQVNLYARQEFIDECRAKSRNDDAYRQEYMCVPSAASSVLISYDLYQSCEAEGILGKWGDGDRYYGFDIGRENDPTVLWGAEQVGDVLITRENVKLQKMKYGLQKKIIHGHLSHPRVIRACGDATGIGDMLVEELQQELGEHKVEKVKFTATSKEVMAGRAVGFLEDRRVRLPDDYETRESFHKIRKTTTANGNTRYDSTRDNEGHADDFWGFALMLEAAHQPAVKPELIWL
jgi:phage FluMu gp28-like protein